MKMSNPNIPNQPLPENSQNQHIIDYVPSVPPRVKNIGRIEPGQNVVISKPGDPGHEDLVANYVANNEANLRMQQAARDAEVQAKETQHERQ
jgi:hypothetical protein